jgi:hypothetical protein
VLTGPNPALLHPDKEAAMADDPVYEERLSSNWTEALFAGLTLLFLMLLIWRIGAGSQDILSASLLILFLVFLFYSVNYRTLIIRLTPRSLNLRFGVFAWRIPLSNTGECGRDSLPRLMWYGGAGIHFMLIRKRYRASFNFLEHPRVVIALRRKVGPVQDVSFSTRHPDQVIQLLRDAVASPSAT